MISPAQEIEEYLRTLYNQGLLYYDIKTQNIRFKYQMSSDSLDFKLIDIGSFLTDEDASVSFTLGHVHPLAVAYRVFDFKNSLYQLGRTMVEFIYSYYLFDIEATGSIFQRFMQEIFPEAEVGFGWARHYNLKGILSKDIEKKIEVGYYQLWADMRELLAITEITEIVFELERRGWIEPTGELYHQLDFTEIMFERVFEYMADTEDSLIGDPDRPNIFLYYAFLKRRSRMFLDNIRMEDMNEFENLFALHRLQGLSQELIEQIFEYYTTVEPKEYMFYLLRLAEIE